MNDMSIENHMVIGPYYPDTPKPRSEVVDEMVRDAMAGRKFDWIGWADAAEVLGDVAHAILTAKTPEEAGVSARRVIEKVVDGWAQDDSDDDRR